MEQEETSPKAAEAEIIKIKTHKVANTCDVFYCAFASKSV